jgi:predicted metal-dependent hydrolase
LIFIFIFGSKNKTMAHTCKCPIKKSNKIKQLEKVYNTNIVNCDCFNIKNNKKNSKSYLEGYYIKDLKDELIDILAKYDQIMQQDIDEINIEKEKNRSQGHLYDLEIEGIKYNYAELKQAISVGYFIRTDI